jgi:hypothetical protein
MILQEFQGQSNTTVEENQDTCEDFHSPWLEEAEEGTCRFSNVSGSVCEGVLLVLQERHTFGPVHYGSGTNWSYCLCPLHMVSSGYYQQARDLKEVPKCLKKSGGWNLSIGELKSRLIRHSVTET